MNSKMVNAWLLGASILIVVCSAWLLLLKLKIYSHLMAMVLWLSPGIAAFVVAYLAPSHKITMGTSMGLLAAPFAVLLNTTPQLTGEAVDFPGLKGGLIFFTIMLTGSAVLSSLGAIAGHFLTRNRGQGEVQISKRVNHVTGMHQD